MQFTTGCKTGLTGWNGVVLDQIMPMAYSTSEEEVKQQIKKALEVAGKTPVIAGLGAYRMLEDSRRLERIIKQVQK